MPKEVFKTINLTGAPNQRSNPKLLDPGTPTELVNYRRFRDGQLDTRVGWEKTQVSTFVGGTYQGPAVELHPYSSAALLEDALGQLWVKNGAQAHYRGTRRNATWTSTSLESAINYNAKPLFVTSGTERWCFTLGFVPGLFGPAVAFQVSVVDSSGIVLRDPETGPAYTFDVSSWSACVLDGVVHLFVADNSNTIKVLRFASATAAPVSSTWHTEAGAYQFYAVDCHPSAVEIIVAAQSAHDSGGDRITGVLRTKGISTGGAAASTFSAHTYVGGAGTGAIGGINVLVHDSADGFCWLVYTGQPSGSGGKLIREKVTLSTCVVSAAVTLATLAPVGTALIVAASGYIEAGVPTVLVTCVSTHAADSTLHKVCDATIRKFVDTTEDTGFQSRCRSAVLASKPFKVGTAWQFLSFFDDGYNDGTNPDTNTGIQNGYWLRNIDGRIRSSVLDGDASLSFHRAPIQDGTSRGTYVSSHVVAPVVEGTEVLVHLTDQGVSRLSPGRRLVTIETEPDCFSSAEGIVPGGVICRVSGQDVLSELSPCHYPYGPVTDDGLGVTAISTNYVTVRYCIINEQDEQHPSAPTEAVLKHFTVFFTAGVVTLTLPTYRHQITEGTCFIQVFGSPPSGASSELYLQASCPNDPTVDSVTLTVYPALWNADGPLLETVGGGLPPISPPPAEVVWSSGRRLFLGRVSDSVADQVWPSFETIPGEGYEFSSDFAFRLPKGSGDLVTGSDVDGISFLLFCQNGIWLATGAGPDGKGQGVFTLTKVSTDVTAASPRCVAQRGDAVHFTDRKTGRAFVFIKGQLQDAYDGMEAYRTKTIVAAVHRSDDDEDVTRFFASDGTQVVFDATFKDSWILHRGAGLPTAIGARLINDQPVLLAAGDAASFTTWTPSAGTNTTTHFMDDGVQILPVYESGDMELAGKGNEFDTDTCIFQSALEGGACTYVYRLTDAKGVQENHTDASTDNSDFHFRSARFRTHRIRFRIECTASTGKGRSFETLSIGIRPYGPVRLPARKI